MSTTSDVTITRQEALKALYDIMIYEHGEFLKLALNSMTNRDLGSRLHNDMYFYDVEGKGKLE